VLHNQRMYFRAVEINGLLGIYCNIIIRAFANDVSLHTERKLRLIVKSAVYKYAYLLSYLLTYLLTSYFIKLYMLNC